MGYIAEPSGVDFFVDSKPPTAEDLRMVSEAIAHYKSTVEKKTLSKTNGTRKKHDKNVAKAKL